MAPSWNGYPRVSGAKGKEGLMDSHGFPSARTVLKVDPQGFKIDSVFLADKDPTDRARRDPLLYCPPCNSRHLCHLRSVGESFGALDRRQGQIELEQLSLVECNGIFRDSVY
jgi:hypothetical protein